MYDRVISASIEKYPCREVPMSDHIGVNAYEAKGLVRHLHMLLDGKSARIFGSYP